MNAAKLRALLRDETDPPNLPPFITRSSRPPVRMVDESQQMSLHQIFAKFEQGLRHNFGGVK